MQEGNLTVSSTHASPPSTVNHQAFLGLELGKRCYPDPVMANADGSERIEYRPTEDDICIDENGQETRGLTYEGELNKVRRR